MASETTHTSSVLLLVTASVGCAMTLVDTNVVAVAVPAIGRHFMTDAAGSQWIVSAYFLCFAASLLAAGAIADRLGRRRTFLCGVAGLAVASLLCGFATTISGLHLARGLQGVMTAFVLAPALALIGHRFHTVEDRNKAWATWGGVMGVTMVMAPLAGGLIVELLDWRWAFFLNIPICAMLAVGVLAYAEESRDTTRGPLDPWGIALFAAAMFGLTWALINGQNGGWISPTTLFGLVTGIAGLIGFVIAERIQARPMLNLKLFAIPQFVGAVLAMFAYAATAQVMASLFPIFLQTPAAPGAGEAHIGSLSSSAAGAAMLPFASAMLIFPYVGAKLGRRIASPAILVLGLLAVAAGNLIAAWGAASSGWLTLLLGTFVIGSGGGLLNGETQKAIMAAMPRDQTGVASGISTTARFTGILIGFAVLNAVTSVTRTIPALTDGRGNAGAIAFSASLVAAAAFAAVSATIVCRLMRQPLSAGNS